MGDAERHVRFQLCLAFLDQNGRGGAEVTAGNHERKKTLRKRSSGAGMMARFSYNCLNEANRITLELTLWRAAQAACQLTPCPRTSLASALVCQQRCKHRAACYAV